MMQLCYNLLQLMTLVVLAPLWLLLALRPKYRSRVLARLGMGLPPAMHLQRAGRPLIWIHALSLGEVSSAVPLVSALRGAMPQACLVLTATTRSGLDFARDRLGGKVDYILPAPFDIIFSVRRFAGRLAPALFILVETDFWPNWLAELSRRDVPLILVNGRISAASWRSYRRAALFFRPLFQRFTLLCSQTGADAERFAALGIARRQLAVLGNLKFASFNRDQQANDAGQLLSLPPGAMLWVCGSTHRGEDDIVLQVFRLLRQKFPQLHLLLAPRDVSRGAELAALAAGMGLACHRRSVSPACTAPVLLLDTLGELAACYGAAAVAFIGGSLIQAGGHNPLEAAARGIPVLFGPHMEDFEEIADELVAAQAAQTVANADELFSALDALLSDSALRQRMGVNAANLMANHGQVVEQHLARILPFCRHRDTGSGDAAAH